MKCERNGEKSASCGRRLPSHFSVHSLQVLYTLLLVRTEHCRIDGGHVESTRRLHLEDLLKNCPCSSIPGARRDFFFLFFGICMEA